MSLVAVLQTNLAEVVLDYVQVTYPVHKHLLLATPGLYNSIEFALAACGQQGFTMRNVAPAMRDDKALSWKAIDVMTGSERNFDDLWTSLSPAVRGDVDFLAFAFACRYGSSWVKKHIPSFVMQSEAFVRAAVSYARFFDPHNDDDDKPTLPQDFVPDEMLGREMAKTLARKGCWPHGSSHLWCSDREIVETYLLAYQRLPDGPYYEEVLLRQEWFTLEWTVDMCKRIPDIAGEFVSYARTPEEERAILEAIPDEEVYHALSILNDARSEVVMARHWRVCLPRNPNVVRLMGSWCEILPSDEPRLTRVFDEDPKQYSASYDDIQALPYVARTVFSKDGLAIRDSPWMGD